MAYCELSGKAPVAKNLVSHSNIKTKSRALPNIQSKRFFSYQLKRSFQFKVAVSAIRNIDKVGGFDTFIVKQKDSALSPRALQVKKQILRKTKKNRGQKGNSGGKHEIKNKNRG